ncbi:MAG: GNAT family N-acetyltransferase [Thermoplasmata archaeon]|nr:GNAT family N-acetyltransferase [Thermoplasmata archaeon]
MPPPDLEIRPSIDREWLEGESRKDPFLHAYALWDLDQYPDRVRFVSAVRGTATLGYLLVWPLAGGGTVVHWVGPEGESEALIEHLPPRPLVVVCAEGAGPAVERARGPAVTHPLLLEAAPPGAPPPAGPLDERVRRLSSAERPLLDVFARRQTDAIATGYVGTDPGQEPVWAGFLEGEIVALARPAVRLPHLWFVGGVYVAPEVRNQGWGRAVVRAVMVEATRAAARCALYVREESAPARALYERLGYRPVARRLMVDAGLHRVP